MMLQIEVLVQSQTISGLIKWTILSIVNILISFTKQTTPRPETADLSTEFDDSVLMPQEYPIKRNDLADQRPSTSLAPHIKKSSRNTNNSVS